ncbi:hypothetical protein [Rhizobium rhizogenes]|uniref:hypothetical protein n=1 Tax=Rhizobium rhizogenes TaxID=359 RepID=UPI001574E078|nr:hypothetical protein [Rhizobium rhizogenes]NTF84427.1 hypothetical protein [Rhizobium rhizogenes]
MIRRYLSKHDHPLDSLDLDLCQRAFDALLVELKLAKDSEEAERVAAMIIELYRQGIHDERQLAILVGGAGGII